MTQEGPEADEPLWLFSEAQTDDAGLARQKVGAQDPSSDSFNGKACGGIWVKLCRSQYFKAGRCPQGHLVKHVLLP